VESVSIIYMNMWTVSTTLKYEIIVGAKEYIYSLRYYQ